MSNFDLMKIKKCTYDDLTKIANHKKIIVFGCPLNIEEILDSKELECISISYIVDNDVKKSGIKVGEYTVYPVSQLENEDKDNVVILVAINFQYMSSVIGQLKEIGIYNVYSLFAMETRQNERLGIKKPFKIIDNFDETVIKTIGDIRSFFTKDLTGYGVEFGAGARPFPVPENCKVEYADFFIHTEGGFYTSWDSENFEMPITYKTSIDEMEGILDNGLDFILTSHVIEHTSNPFLALEKGYQKLKKGSKMVLIVPNMLAFADRVRELTTIEHLDKDYKEPCRERDFIHYAETYIKHGNISCDHLYETIKEAYEQYKDLHYHTFTYESFGNAVNYFCENYYKFSDIVSYPPLKMSKEIEFFYVLTK